MKNINNVKNKYNWKYVFSYHNGNNTTVLTYKTNKGINNATHYATNNMNWDAGSDLYLHSRKRIGKPLQKDIGKLKTRQV
jgi:hypothetical protein